MNAIARTAGSNAFIVFSLPRVRSIMIILALLVTAFGIIYIKDVNRRLFIDYQAGQQFSSALQINYENLLLEKSAWSRQARIQMLARQRLNMRVPSSENVIMVKL